MHPVRDMGGTYSQEFAIEDAPVRMAAIGSINQANPLRATGKSGKIGMHDPQGCHQSHAISSTLQPYVHTKKFAPPGSRGSNPGGLDLYLNPVRIIIV